MAKIRTRSGGAGRGKKRPHDGISFCAPQIVASSERCDFCIACLAVGRDELSMSVRTPVTSLF
jgi:hypothetical protein